MTRIFAIVVAVAAGLALVAASLTAGDRGLFVPPPEAAAENFARQLAAHRFDRALQHMSASFRDRAGVQALREIVKRAEDAHGPVDRVDSEPVSVGDDDAEAEIRYTHRRGHSEMICVLVRESGLWVVDDVKKS